MAELCAGGSRRRFSRGKDPLSRLPAVLINVKYARDATATFAIPDAERHNRHRRNHQQYGPGFRDRRRRCLRYGEPVRAVQRKRDRAGYIRPGCEREIRLRVPASQVERAACITCVLPCFVSSPFYARHQLHVWRLPVINRPSQRSRSRFAGDIGNQAQFGPSLGRG